MGEECFLFSMQIGIFVRLMHLFVYSMECKAVLFHRRRIVWFNLSPPGQNARHFPDDIFKRIFLNENGWILIEISLKIVPTGPIDNKPALV